MQTKGCFGAGAVTSGQAALFWGAPQSIQPDICMKRGIITSPNRSHRIIESQGWTGPARSSGPTVLPMPLLPRKPGSGLHLCSRSQGWALQMAWVGHCSSYFNISVRSWLLQSFFHLCFSSWALLKYTHFEHPWRMAQPASMSPLPSWFTWWISCLPTQCLLSSVVSHPSWEF